MSEDKTIHDLFVDELQDIYFAEKLLAKSLKKMAKAATNEDLKQGFLDHQAETEGQIERLEQVFEELGERAKAKTCEAMKGLIEEATEMMGEDYSPEVMDVALISCAQKVEHYEIASYGTLVTLAHAMGHETVASILQETLDEETACDEKLTELAESDINPAAMESYESESETEQNHEGIFGNFGLSGKKRERYAEMQRSVDTGRKPGRPAGRKSAASKATGRKSPGRPKKAGRPAGSKSGTRKQAAARSTTPAKKSAKRASGRGRS